MKNSFLRILIILFITITGLCAQVRPKVALIGGDDVPLVKDQIRAELERILLEMNRVQAGRGSIAALKPLFSDQAYCVFSQYVLQNKPQTARKAYEPQMVERQKGQAYDIRSIMVKINVGDTEASSVQNLIFTFSRDGLITSFRSMLPTYDYQTIISRGETLQDSMIRGCILDFMEQFRMAYNAKNMQFLEKVYSEEALILVGSVLQEKRQADDMMKHTLLAPAKIKFIQQTKQEYIAGLKDHVFIKNTFLNIRFNKFTIVRHEKIPWLYGVSCFQKWNSSHYSDEGFLFLMMDFRKLEEPVIHVRTWQPKAFDDGQYVSLDDFEVVAASKE